MEDEHVCIDNLVHYLGAPEGFPAPGAFYGVSYLLLRILVYLLIDCNVVTFFLRETVMVLLVTHFGESLSNMLRIHS